MKFIYLLLCLSFFAHPNAFAVSGPADITDPGPGNRRFEETKGRPFNFVQKFKAKLALKLMKKKLRNVEEGKNSGPFSLSTSAGNSISELSFDVPDVFVVRGLW